MKKMLKGLAGFAIVLALVVGVVGTVFANESKSGDVTVATEDNFIVIDQEAFAALSFDYLLYQEEETETALEEMITEEAVTEGLTEGGTEGVQ